MDNLCIFVNAWQKQRLTKLFAPAPLEPVTNTIGGVVTDVLKIDLLGDVPVVYAPNVPAADLLLAGQLHGHALIPYQDSIDYRYVKILNVDVTRADPSQIQWDFLVKTYLRKDRAKHNYEKNAVQWNIDKSINQSVITDLDRVDKFKQLATKMAQSNPYDPMLDSPLKFINLDYEQLFQIGGSQYLCEQLNITVGTKYHHYWNQQLPWAQSPDILHVWNTVWNKSDFFN